LRIARQGYCGQYRQNRLKLAGDLHRNTRPGSITGITAVDRGERNGHLSYAERGRLVSPHGFAQRRTPYSLGMLNWLF
jgi:hypothetical protein